MKKRLFAAMLAVGFATAATAQVYTTTTTVKMSKSYSPTKDLVADETTMQIQKSAIKIESDNTQITMSLLSYFNEGGVKRYVVKNSNYGATSTTSYTIYIEKTYLPQVQHFFKQINEQKAPQSVK